LSNTKCENIKNQTVQFRGLKSIRGLASSVVILAHIDQFHYLFKYESIGISKTSLADDAVTLFFVLSGFLITFLLMKEKEERGKINIRNFYIRRILRIWPVYYIAFAISLVLIHSGIVSKPENLNITVLLYIFFAANVAYALGFVIRSIIPLWSVGVEEQFYAIWPLIVDKSKLLASTLIGLILIYLVLKILWWHVDRQGGEFALISLTRIDCMAVGGLFAYWHYNNMLKHLLFSRWLNYFSFAFILLSSFINISLFYSIEVELKAFFFGVLILNASTNEKAVFQPENKILDFLGTISYGLYSYHMIVIFLVSYFLQQFNLEFLQSSYIFVQLLTLGFSVLIAFLSYNFIERPLLEFKTKFV